MQGLERISDSSVKNPQRKVTALHVNNTQIKIDKKIKMGKNRPFFHLNGIIFRSPAPFAVKPYHCSHDSVRQKPQQAGPASQSLTHTTGLLHTQQRAKGMVAANRDLKSNCGGNTL